MASNFFGEFMGTMILILMGNGAVANMLLKRSKAEGTGWLAITTGWAFAVMTGVFTAIACGSPDAHINPAVTLAFAIKTGDFSKLAPYIVAQMLGAMAGAVLPRSGVNTSVSVAGGRVAKRATSAATTTSTRALTRLSASSNEPL